MMLVGIVLALLLVLLLPGAAFLLGRYLQRRPEPQELLSAVMRQHIELYQGAPFNQAAVESAKERFVALLDRGEAAAVEAALRPGTQYVFQVRALSEIGSETAGQILERQLQRRLTDDHLEQTWYWIDVAHGLRMLNRPESLPHLLRCADAAGAAPLGHFYAAETVCFLGFAGYVRQPDTALGRAALRTLHRAVEGVRFGVHPQLVAEARLGELVDQVWDRQPASMSPLHVRLAIESLRLLRRSPHLKPIFSDDASDREAFEWQMSRLAALEPALRDYLQKASLLPLLHHAKGIDRADVLHAMNDLRCDTGVELLRYFQKGTGDHAEAIIAVLRWSRDPRVGQFLRDFAERTVPMRKRAKSRRSVLPPSRPSLSDDIPYHDILRSLRGHPSAETEVVLVLASQDWDPTFRMAAYSSLGWWEPVHRAEVMEALQTGRRDPNPEVRHCARAALARLGERAALHWFRQALLSEQLPQRLEAIHFIAQESLTLLWPELDRLADSEDPDIAVRAWEAIERLAEQMDGA